MTIRILRPLRCAGLSVPFALILGAQLCLGAETPDGEDPAPGQGDATYQLLRNVEIAGSFEVSNLTLQRDVGKFVLESGTFSFVRPVLDRVTIGIFIGKGRFELDPPLPWEKRNLELLTENTAVKEGFKRMVVCFTDDTFSEITAAGRGAGTEARASAVLKDFRQRRRNGDSAHNVEAEILTHLYNGNFELFTAYMTGGGRKDLRFYFRPDGALIGSLSSEEVAVVNEKGEGAEVWYSAHRASKYQGNRPFSEGVRRQVGVSHYEMDITIPKSRRLAVNCRLRLQPRVEGLRALRLSLIRHLRVSKVLLAGRQARFIQEHKERDAAFHILFPHELTKGEEYELTIEYAGNKVVRAAGGGNFSIRARSSWYPNVGAFSDRSTFDLTFHYPKGFTLVGVGKLVEESKEGNTQTARWTSEIPLAVAGFNYGRFKKQKLEVEGSGYAIEGYAASKVPDALKTPDPLPVFGERREGLPTGNMKPSRLIKKVMAEAQASIQLFSHWFGELPYGRIALTQQPEFGFGQSWPTLVYLPVSAFLDSTQRWALLGGGAFEFAEFVQEVTPHEVAHQWWGHIVGWESYHDQWLSEGFSDYSAALFLQATRKNPQPYLKFLKRWRQAISEKNRFGLSPNDTGPIWMGYRLSTRRSPRAYSRLVYAKGGYVLHMLRQLMVDPKTGDQGFREMMHDFVKSHYNKAASTESFKQVVEKHMTPAMNLDGNGRMDWFFDQWVYGTEVPSYQFQYKLTPKADGKALLEGSLTQSGVSDNFKMAVPIYLDFGGRLVNLGGFRPVGNVTVPFQIELPRKPARVLINAFDDVLAREVVNKDL